MTAAPGTSWRHKIRKFEAENFQNKKIGRRVVTNRMVTIEIVISSIRVMGTRVTISCRYCIAFEVMLLFLVFECVLCVCH